MLYFFLILMAFNTLHFIYFFGIFFLAFHSARKFVPLQNCIIIAGSYFFYGYANIKLPLVLFAVSGFSYLGAYFLSKSKQKLPTLIILLTLLLGQLFYFKYINWIFPSGSNPYFQLINTIGISYFTLAAYSYLVDIYRQKISFDTNPLSLFSYLSFFPQLLSGPIPIAHIHLAQFNLPKTLSIEATETAFQRIAWGLFKKVIISSLLASEVNYIFYNYSTLSYLYLWLGIILYSFQVYMDFSGYSDMAYGISKLLGFNISPNFKSPFISTSIDEFWRRWHLSLSSWLREYVYIPLGGRGNSTFHYLTVILVVFTISGLWHGANATFVLWGFFNGLLFTISILFGLNQKAKEKTYSWTDLFKIIAVFISISFTRVLFRSVDLQQAIQFYKNMFIFSNHTLPDIGLKALLFSVCVVLIEFLQKNQANASDITRFPMPIKLALYTTILVLTVVLWPVINSTEYIYFKF